MAAPLVAQRVVLLADQRDYLMESQSAAQKAGPKAVQMVGQMVVKSDS